MSSALASSLFPPTTSHALAFMTTRSLADGVPGLFSRTTCFNGRQGKDQLDREDMKEGRWHHHIPRLDLQIYLQGQGIKFPVSPTVKYIFTPFLRVHTVRARHLFAHGRIIAIIKMKACQYALRPAITILQLCTCGILRIGLLL